MQQWTVRDVMTTQVLTIAYEVPPAELVKTMTDFDVSAVAVVDAYDSVLGIVTRSDVLKAIEVREPERRFGRRVAGPVFTARSAGELMSAPALTVGPEATLAQAGRLMRTRGVNRLLVTGAGRRLLGIVTAADLLKVYERPDEAIRAEVRQLLATLPADDLAVGVHDGVVTIAGSVAEARTATLAERLARDVPGVTAVRSEIAVSPPEPPAADAPPKAQAVAIEATPSRRRSLDGWWLTRRPARDNAPAGAERRPAASAAVDAGYRSG